MEKETAVVLLSGGQDSTTCLYWALSRYDYVYGICFDYGQRHRVELRQARLIALNAKIPLKEIDLSFLLQIGNSALLNDGDINETHPQHSSLPASFVPNRNQIFLTVAHAYAQSMGANAIVIGACQTDYSGYPDCRDNFIKLLQGVTNIGSESDIRFETPLMFLSKPETFNLAADLQCLEEVIENSHTCYNGDRSEPRKAWGYGCGNCPACKLREKGFADYLNWGM
jgi:7-cyano-7-deazaguanine synthase